jgi:hypothetical protein
MTTRGGQILVLAGMLVLAAVLLYKTLRRWKS